VNHNTHRLLLELVYNYRVQIFRNFLEKQTTEMISDASHDTIVSMSDVQ